MPYAIDIAIGIRNCACLLSSKIRGAKPTTVVIEVRKIALNLARPASYRASSKDNPSLKLLLNFPINTRPSFTIIPIKAIIPSIDKIFTG